MNISEISASPKKSDGKNDQSPSKSEKVERLVKKPLKRLQKEDTQNEKKETKQEISSIKNS